MAASSHSAPRLAVSVVVPVFGSRKTLQPLVDRINAALSQITHEIILVDDGSPPDTWEVLSELTSTRPFLKCIRLSRNFGQHSALLAGIRSAQFGIVATLDDDLQNPPEAIPVLVDALVSSGNDVIYGTPASVSRERWRVAGSAWSKSAMSLLLGAQSAKKISSFRAFRTELREGFAAHLGPSVSIDALLSWSTTRFGSVEVPHSSREDGSSNYNFRKLAKFALDTATGYSSGPLRLSISVGFATAALGFCILGYVLVRFFIGGSVVPGFTFLAALISILSGSQLLALGIMGEYLARMHFRIMNKPTFVISEVRQSKGSSTT